MNHLARILVIEDNQPNRELMVYLLNAFGLCFSSCPRWV